MRHSGSGSGTTTTNLSAPNTGKVAQDVRAFQDTHDNLNANVTLQIGDVDAPGGEGITTSSTPRVTANLDGKESTLNSSSALLGVGGVFTGTVEDVMGYGTLKIFSYSDVAAASSGLLVQYSEDGTTWGKFDSPHSPDAGIAHVFTETPMARYMRIKYTNGGTGQTAFSLKAVLSKFPAAGSMLTVDHTVSDNRVAQLVRAVLTAKKPNGDYVNITATAGGNLKSSIQEFDQALTSTIAGAEVLETVNYARLAEPRDRTYIKKSLEAGALGAGTTIHTVTAGKIFWMTGLEISAVNQQNAIGRFTIQDGTDTADRMPYIMPQQLIGGIAGALDRSENHEQNPVPFSVDVRAIGIAGTITASITITGYEE